MKQKSWDRWGKIFSGGGGKIPEAWGGGIAPVAFPPLTAIEQKGGSTQPYIVSGRVTHLCPNLTSIKYSEPFPNKPIYNLYNEYFVRLVPFAQCKVKITPCTWYFRPVEHKKLTSDLNWILGRMSIRSDVL